MSSATSSSTSSFFRKRSRGVATALKLCDYFATTTSKNNATTKPEASPASSASVPANEVIEVKDDTDNDDDVDKKEEEKRLPGMTNNSMKAETNEPSAEAVLDNNKNATSNSRVDSPRPNPEDGKDCNDDNGDMSNNMKNHASPNPFAAFAYSPRASSSSLLSLSARVSATPIGSALFAKKLEAQADEAPQTKKRKKSQDDKKKKKEKDRKTNAICPTSFDELDATEQERIRKKWHSMAQPQAPLHIRRFQVLIAARLHAQAQEAVVRCAMQALQKSCDQAGAMWLDASTLAAMDPTKVATLISSVHYHNAKAQHIVQAARQIELDFNGIVPCTKTELQQLMGIGPTLAEILSRVNSMEAYSDNDNVAVVACDTKTETSTGKENVK